MAKLIEAFQPQALHIATEGPLGFAARRYCIAHGLTFTTSYHTQFPQYLRERFPIPTCASPIGGCVGSTARRTPAW